MSQQTTNKTTVETANSRFVFHENGILYLYVRDDLSIDVPVAQEMVQNAQEIGPSGHTRLLIVCGLNNDISFGAQRTFASATGFSRVVFMTRNRLQAEVGQFLVTMMRTLKSNYEFNLFYEIKQAETWLLRP
ncbi:MAG: hypothetical protein IT327_04210 [Anaerolineae bacterium]|nr:hypothetical protein [Anaerolineae bacterium]